MSLFHDEKLWDWVNTCTAITPTHYSTAWEWWLLMNSWGMKLGHWSKFQKLHIYSLSTPGGQNWGYFCFTGSGSRNTSCISKLPYLGMKLGHWQKILKLNIYPLPTPRGRNWAYFHSTGSSFLDTGRFWKLPYLGMKHLAIGQTYGSCTYTLFLRQGVEIELIFALQAAVSEIRTDFQNCHIWAGTSPMAKYSEVTHTDLFLPWLSKMS